MRPPTRGLPLLTLALAACGSAPPPPADVALPPPSAPPAAPAKVEAPRVARPWGAPWRVVEAFRGASEIFAPTMDLCASGPTTTRCLGSTELGPVAGAVLSSPAKVWADGNTPEAPCVVHEDGRLLCGLGRDWKLAPVPGAGTARRVFGGYDWICALDDGGTARCVREGGAGAP
jgi:hypothetical protein